MDELIAISESHLKKISTNFKRYLFDEINWEDRLIGIKGARGVGKTTLLLQRLRFLGLSFPAGLYISLDDLYFTKNTMVETAKKFRENGGRVLLLDEVHKYPGWSREIKNLYDRYDDLKIIFTGSSIIDISKQEGDLSRRALMYELRGMSYREFLAAKYGLALPTLSLEQILSGKTRDHFPENFKPLKHFQEYLEFGYYPFSLEDEHGYHQRLRQLIRLIVEIDMADLKGFDIRHAKKMLTLLYVIAQQVPFMPNISQLSNKTGIHRNSINNYLHFLSEAKMLSLLNSPGVSIALLQKPEKIFVENTNLLFALAEKAPSTGTVRETFFQNQLSEKHRVNQAKKSDFLIDDTLTFEIGGPNKSSKQIAETQNSFVVAGDVEWTYSNKLPLWIFGFLY